MTNKITLEVPDRVKYLSNWKELDNLLVGNHIIINKKITGCGATSYFLNHPSMKVILCSPRILLLEDKFKQCKQFTHWFRNGDNSEEDINDEEPETREVSESSLNKYKNALKDYIVKTYGKYPPKILVTYDSLKYVIDTLKEFGENLDEYTIVVDEFHSIFQDCKFKPETELGFLKTLESVRRVIYLSATPILEKYLDQMDEFKNLPYYELEWPKNRLTKATINRIKVDNLNLEAIKIINTFLGGLYPTKIIDGKIVESKEAVLYINSVKDICTILKKTNLPQKDVNILCANTSINTKKLKKVGHVIGTIPGKGEQHKMFTFCTRTSFLGTDFYSTNASTYIFANPNINSLSLDISMDIPQILGRQRLECNPFRNDITLFYETIDVLQDIKEFEKHINTKIEKTNSHLNNFKIIKESNGSIEDLLNKYMSAAIVDRYAKDYVGISGNSEAKFNKLVYFSDLRSWEIQQMNFKDGYTLLNTLENEGFIVNDKNINENDYTNFYNQFTNTRSFETKMTIYCKMIETVGENGVKNCCFIPAKFHKMYDSLGIDKIKNLKYREKSINDFLAIKKIERKLYKELTNTFREGDRFSLADIKKSLGIIYKGLDLNINPKASDLNKFFIIKKIKTSSRADGYEIISHTISNEIKDNISLYKRAYITDNSIKVSLDDIFNIIKTGSNGIKESIERIRFLKDHNLQNNLKYLNLPLVCWCGEFTKRNKQSLVNYSSFLALDIDNIGNDKIANYKNKLKNYPYIKSIFLSPSGNGLKVIVQHDNQDSRYHKELFKEIAEKLNIKELDWSVSDLARGNYLSYDPDIYINENCVSYKFSTIDFLVETNSEIAITEDKKVKFYDKFNSLEDNRILGCLDSYWNKNFPESHREGNRHNSVLRQAVKLNRVGIEKDITLSYLEVSFKNLPIKEIQNIVNYVYTENINEFGIDRNSFKI